MRESSVLWSLIGDNTVQSLCVIVSLFSDVTGGTRPVGALYARVSVCVCTRVCCKWQEQRVLISGPSWQVPVCFLFLLALSGLTGGRMNLGRKIPTEKNTHEFCLKETDAI